MGKCYLKSPRLLRTKHMEICSPVLLSIVLCKPLTTKHFISGTVSLGSHLAWDAVMMGLSARQCYLHSAVRHPAVAFDLFHHLMEQPRRNSPWPLISFLRSSTWAAFRVSLLIIKERQPHLLLPEVSVASIFF